MTGSPPAEHQVDLGVQVAQQAVGQRVGQGAQLLLGGLDDRAQCCLAGDHLRPGQSSAGPPEGQGHRIFGGEPAHGARQVQVGSSTQIFGAAVALHVDADRPAPGARKP